MADDTTLRTITDAWHLVALLGLLSHSAALATDSATLAAALAACCRGQVRPAATLTATAAASFLAGAYLS